MKERRTTPSPRSARRRALGLLVPPILTFGCSDPQPKPLPPSVPVMNVSMTEYRFAHDADAPGGRTVFRVRNAGRVDHALTLVRLPDDVTVPVQKMLEGEKRRAVPTTARLLRRTPGSLGTFAVDLAPGRYALLCFLADEDGTQHVEKGMVSELKVRSS